MNYWKENINYRQDKTANGQRFLITVENQDVEVSEEIYKVYTQMERRERYLVECDKDILISLDQMQEDDMKLEFLSSSNVESAEETVVRTEREQEKHDYLKKLPKAMAHLTDEERELINALYFEGVPVREYARITGVRLFAVQKRRDRILEKHKIFLF